MRRIHMSAFLLTLLPAWNLALAEPFSIQVVDEVSGRGIPLVELRTVNAIRLYTDSHGHVAFEEPGLMDQKVYFHVSSHGYAKEKDGFGNAGVALDVRGGGKAVIRMRRINIAERLYRVTGQGIYRDSLLLGEAVPLKHPALNGQVLGSDSVLTSIYHNRLFWIWGDTGRPAYPLGNFFASGATSRLPGDGGLDPDLGVDLTYFVDDTGFAQKMAPMEGTGPCWLSGMITLADDNGREHLLAGYARVRTNMEAYERGIVEFDDAKQQFIKIRQFDLDSPAKPEGHALRVRDEGREFIYFTHPLPLTRTLATRDAYLDVDVYETYTCLQQGTRPEEGKIHRDAKGRVCYRWARRTPPVGPAEQETLIKSGALAEEEALIQLRDPESGDRVRPHGGSLAWNPYRGRWVLIFIQFFGTSALGEVWYAEADTPLGPWVYTRKVVTHDKYSFYNPKQHPYFAKDGGRLIYFEGTYSHMFSGNPVRTPRYDYNQIMYRLDLGDERLVLPVPVYRRVQEDPRVAWSTRAPERDMMPEGHVAFHALDRPRAGTVPMYQILDEHDKATGELALGTREDENLSRAPLFHALPADMESPPSTTLPLWSYRLSDTDVDRPAVIMSLDPEWDEEGYRRDEMPLCRVWKAYGPDLPQGAR